MQSHWFHCILGRRQKCWCDGIGRRTGLKIQRWQHRTGSTPVTSTTSERVTLVPIFYFIKNQSPTPLFLLFHKRSRSAHLFGCRRPHDSSLSLPAFAGSGVQEPHHKRWDDLVCLTFTHRSKGNFASLFFAQKTFFYFLRLQSKNDFLCLQTIPRKNQFFLGIGNNLFLFTRYSQTSEKTKHQCPRLTSSPSASGFRTPIFQEGCWNRYRWNWLRQNPPPYRRRIR